MQVPNKKQLIVGFMAAAAYAASSAALGQGNEAEIKPQPAINSTMNAVVAPTFDLVQAQENFRIAVLPIVYERALGAGDSPALAAEKVRSRVPSTTDLSILRHENATAIIAYDKAKAKVIVAYDASDEAADIVDNLKFWGKGHPLGGKTHAGFSNAQFYKDKQGRTLADQIHIQVNDYAAEQPITVGLTGFSRGGAQATIASANWLAAEKSSPTDGQRLVTLSSLYSFGSPPAGDKDFIAGFTEAATKQKLDVWRIIGGDDSVPKNMTNELWYGRDLYRHISPTVYMLPTAAGTEFRVNNPPTKVEQANLSKTNWHDTNVYADLLGVPDAKMTVDGSKISASSNKPPDVKKLSAVAPRLGL